MDKIRYILAVQLISRTDDSLRNLGILNKHVFDSESIAFYAAWRDYFIDLGVIEFE